MPNIADTVKLVLLAVAIAAATRVQRPNCALAVIAHHRPFTAS